MTAARKAQDKPATLLLSTVLADAKNRRIELLRELSDEDVQDVLRRAIKRRRESIEMYDAAARRDLADRERAEVAALEQYLPAGASEEELRAAVREAIAGGAANVGQVMSKVMPQFKARAEGSRLNAIAREELSKQG